jgi:MSHA biogenesis protein MshL
VNRSIQLTSAIAISALLAACATQPANVDMEPLSARAELAQDRPLTVPTPNSESVESPTALTNDLLSLNSAPTSEARIDIEAQNRPAKLFFADLGASQGLNILVDPIISESITLSLRNVTLDQVIAALRDTYGFDFQKTSYGYKVAPNQLTTRVYRLNYLNLERSGSSKTTVGGDDSNTVTTSFAASSDITSGFWAGIQTSLNGFISPNDAIAEPVIINTQTGLVVVHATTKEHNAIARFLTDAELILQKQVIIEAKIVEVTLDHEYRSGINWSFFNDNFGTESTAAGIGLSADNINGIGDVGGVFNLSLSLDNFTSMLQLLDYQGDVQVLSSPRVSTINNQKAVIRVGTDEYFATVSSAQASDDEDASSSTTIGLEKIFSGIALDVTPQIAEDNSVTLHVRPTVTEVVEKTKVLNINNEAVTLPLAYSNIRESDSIIRADSGQIIVIGGLLQQKQDVGSTGIPWLNKVPVVRSLFNQDREAQRKSELVILLKPTVYDDETTLNEFDDVLNRLQ